MAKRSAILMAVSVLTLGLVGILFLKNGNNLASAIPVSPSDNQSSNALMLRDDHHFLQDDSSWSDSYLGNTKETIGAVGCTLSSVAMALANFGIKTTPDQLNKDLTKASGFTKDGWLIWSAISKVTGDKAKVTVYEKPSHKNIEACLANAQYPIVKFHFITGVPHWVIIVGRDTKGNYLIRDPLVKNATPINLSDRTSKIHSLRCVGFSERTAQL